MTSRMVYLAFVTIPLVACSQESASSTPTNGLLRSSPRIIDPSVLDPNHKWRPLAEMDRISVRYAAIPPTKNRIQTVTPTWTDAERREDDELNEMAFPRLVAFRTTDGDLWLTLFNQDRSKGGCNKMVFCLSPSSNNWRLKAIGAFRDSDMGPSRESWLELTGGTITLDTSSCDPSDTIRCKFDLEAKFAVDFALSGSFQYRIRDDIDGIQWFLLREDNR